MRGTGGKSKGWCDTLRYQRGGWTTRGGYDSQGGRNNLRGLLPGLALAHKLPEARDELRRPRENR